MNPAVLRPTFRSQLERRYATHLFGQKHRGEIKDWKYEHAVFHFGHDLRYFPDFLVTGNDDVASHHEVKGPFFREDARVKLFACASAFPEEDFYLVRFGVNGWKADRVRIVVPSWKLREPTA